MSTHVTHADLDVFADAVSDVLEDVTDPLHKRIVELERRANIRPTDGPSKAHVRALVERRIASATGTDTR